MKHFISRLTKVILVVTIPFFILTLIELLTEITGGKIGDYLQNNHGISTRTMVVTLLVLMMFSLAIQIRDKWNSSNQTSDSANSINQQGTGNVAVQDVSGTVTINNYVSSEKKPHRDNIEPDLKILYESLKERYKKRYESKLDGRFEITLEVNEDWRFDQPATYKFSAEAKVSEAATAVRKAFDEKGRLLIVGNAGSGKTVLLLNLARQLLGDELKKDQQIPVIFNLASWRETYENFEDWLIDMLENGSGLPFTLKGDFARKILHEKRIILMLDGLDELARNDVSRRKVEDDYYYYKITKEVDKTVVMSDDEKAHELKEFAKSYEKDDRENALRVRAKCLDSLNDYLEEGREAVICCRQAEFVEMRRKTKQEAPVSASVNILELDSSQIDSALNYIIETKPNNTDLSIEERDRLKSSKASAENLAKLLLTNKTLQKVINNPFYFSTALAVFDNQIIKNKKLPAQKEKLEKYLLKTYIEKKITKSHLLKDFTNDTKKINQWLKWLAKLLDRKRLVTFELSDLQPSDLMKTRKYTQWSLYGSQDLYSVFNWVDRFDPNKLLTEDNVYLNFSKITHREYWDSFFGVFFTNLIFSILGGIGYGLYYNAATGLGVGILLLVFTSLFKGLMVGFENLKDLKEIAKPERPYQRINSGLRLNLIIFGILVLCLLGFHSLISKLEHQILTYSIYTVPRYLFEFWEQDNFGKDFAQSLFQLIKSDPNYFKNEWSTDIIEILSATKDIVWVYVFGSIMIPQLLRFTTFKHLLLRYYLWREKLIPLKFVTFLDLAAEARILEKDGGQWRFRHQNLQEYFANLEIETDK